MAKRISIIVIITVLVLFVSGIVIIDQLPKWAAPVQDCNYKLRQLGLYFAMLSENSKPIDDNWCDQIIVEFFNGTYSKEVYSIFSCIKDNAEKHQSTYALNTNAVGRMKFSNEMVILFDSKKGWNNVGGPELLAPENNKGQGCYILFGNFKTKFIKISDLDKLNWK
jgi:hypothetical protein